MVKKRKSMGGPHPPADVTSPSTEERRKKKKKRRESDPGMVASGTESGPPDTGGTKAGSLVLRCAPKGAVTPVVVSFSNLTVPPDTKTLKFVMHGGIEDATKHQRVVMTEGSRMDYWGVNFGPGDESNDLCRYLVGVEDAESGEVTLYEAGHPYALRQSVSGRDDVVEDRANEDMSWKERRDQLVNQFGSKKKKAAIRSRDANVIEAENVVGGGALSRVLTKALKDDGAGNRETDGAAGAVEEARRKFLPPIRLEASTPEGVYSATDIALEPVLETMAKQIDAKAEGLEEGLQEWVNRFSQQPKERCPSFVSKRLGLLPEVSSPKQRLRMLQLLFLRHMCVFCLSPCVLKGTASTLSRQLGIPEVVMRHFLEKFTVCESKQRGGFNTYSRTKTLKNQLVVHTLCLALVLEGCRLEFEDLAQDLKLSTTETRALMRELGCSATNTTAQLKIPVVFPRSRKGRANN